MKKIDLGQTVQILANIGVIAGIIFLGIELRQNNRLLQNEARLNLQRARTDEIEQTVLNPELSELWQKAVTGEPLTVSERQRFSNMMLGRFVRWEWYYEQYSRGLIDLGVLPVAAWRGMFSDGPIIAEIWRDRSGLLSPEFVQWMEKNVVHSE